MTTRRTITLDDELDERIDALVDTGAFDSRSQFHRVAAEYWMTMLPLAGEAIAARSLKDDNADPEDVADFLQAVREAEGGDF